MLAIVPRESLGGTKNFDVLRNLFSGHPKECISDLLGNVWNPVSTAADTRFLYLQQICDDQSTMNQTHKQNRNERKEISGDVDRELSIRINAVTGQLNQNES